MCVFRQSEAEKNRSLQYAIIVSNVVTRRPDISISKNVHYLIAIMRLLYVSINRVGSLVDVNVMSNNEVGILNISLIVAYQL